jgi:hypothetical protein
LLGSGDAEDVLLLAVHLVHPISRGAEGVGKVSKSATIMAMF